MIRQASVRTQPHVLLALALVGLLLLFACGSPEPARFTQKVAGRVITLETNATPKLNAAQSFLVTVTDAQGQPIDGADVYLDLTMPTMPMGTNRPIAEPQGQGHYLASSVYTMTGDWEISVVVELAGSEQRAVFSMHVTE